MAISIASLIPFFYVAKILMILSGSTIFFYSIRLYFKTRLTITLYFGFSAFLSVFTTVSILPFLGFESAASVHAIAVILHSSIVLFLASLIFFIEKYEGNLTLLKSGVAIVIASVGIYNGLLSLSTDTMALNALVIKIDSYTFINGSEQMGTIISLVFLWAMIWVYQVLRKTSKNIVSVELKRQNRIIRVGLFITVVFSFFVSVPGAIFTSTGKHELGVLFVQIFLQVSIAIGFMVTAIGYLSSTQIAMLQPQKYETLIVIDNSGLPLLQYEFGISERDETQSTLISGAITAITALMDEAFGVKTSLEAIRFGDKEIIVTFVDNTAFLLVISKTTDFAKDALKRFSLKFTEKFKGILSEAMINPDDFKDATRDIEYYFGLT